MTSESDQATPAISLRGIEKRYRLWSGGARGFTALHDINLEVAPGECLGIIGRNGSGKTTLLQILAGILKPTAGRGRVNGEVASLLALGSGFHRDFTGRENIRLNNAILGVAGDRAQERMDRIEAFADIGAFLDEPIRTYSQGMLLRLGFACAIAVEPDVFLVDEALAVGDIFFQQKCHDYLRRQMRVRTRVLVSHNMQVITSSCTRVVVLENGSIVFDGEPLPAVEHYMKALHDSRKHTAGRRAAGGVAGSAAPAPVTAPAIALDWRAVNRGATGGIGEVLIRETALAVNGDPATSVVKPGDRVQVRLRVEISSPKSELLFGYLVRDKTGNDVFGDNSASLEHGVVAAEAGAGEIALEFAWPEVRPADYFLTLGVGEGRDPIQHEIQCWVHNVYHFNAVSPVKPVHCLFNHPLQSFQFSPHGADKPMPEVAAR